VGIFSSPPRPDRLWGPPRLSTGGFYLGTTRPEREADHSPPSSAEVRNAWSYTSTSQYVFMAWCLVKAQGQLYFYLPSQKHITSTRRHIIMKHLCPRPQGTCQDRDGLRNVVFFFSPLNHLIPAESPRKFHQTQSPGKQLISIHNQTVQKTYIPPIELLKIAVEWITFLVRIQI